jgi:hypothetical protein
MVAKDDSGALREASYGGPQALTLPLIGHQPDAGEGCGR